MQGFDLFRLAALALPEVMEQPHFDKTSFRIAKKIFATAVPGQNRATVKLSLADQDVFCTFDSNVIYPVPNKWGKQGWTHIDLALVKGEMLTEILKCAYKEVAPRKLGDMVTFDGI